MADGMAYPINPTIPGHVPPDRVRDYDVYQPSAPGTDYFAGLACLRAEAPPIFWTRNNGGHWVATDSNLVREMLRDSDRFSSHVLVVPRANNPPGRGFVPIHLDPPEHTQYRAHLSLALSRKQVHEMTEGIRSFTIGLIEELQPRGACDFVADFAFHMPIRVFLRLVDLPEEHRLGLLAEVSKMIHPGGDKAAAVRQLMEYLAPVVAARRADPGDDLISWLSVREVHGVRMSEADLLSMCTLLLIGGLDSVANTLGFVARFLADNPAHRRRLIEEPAIVSRAVEELLRRFPTVQAGNGREVVHDTELGGITLKRGDVVMAPTSIMNFGALDYNNPLEVNFDRPVPAVGTFGHGPHKCPGANLARTEITIFLQEWLKRIPDFQVKPGAKVDFVSGVNISYAELPLVWKNK
jgi:cytochrome P450